MCEARGLPRVDLRPRVGDSDCCLCDFGKPGAGRERRRPVPSCPLHHGAARAADAPRAAPRAPRAARPAARTRSTDASQTRHGREAGRVAGRGAGRCMW